MLLPTLEVTDAQANRMLAAYGSVAAYKEWLKNEIIEFVVRRENEARLLAARQAYEDAGKESDQRMKQARIDLGQTP